MGRCGQGTLGDRQSLGQRSHGPALTKAAGNHIPRRDRTASATRSPSRQRCTKLWISGPQAAQAAHPRTAHRQSCSGTLHQRTCPVGCRARFGGQQNEAGTNAQRRHPAAGGSDDEALAYVVQANSPACTCLLMTGPPLLPLLMAASVCTASRLMQPCESVGWEEAR